MEYRCISSLCQQKEEKHIPTYTHGCVTPEIGWGRCLSSVASRSLLKFHSDLL